MNAGSSPLPQHNAERFSHRCGVGSREARPCKDINRFIDDKQRRSNWHDTRRKVEPMVDALRPETLASVCHLLLEALRHANQTVEPDHLELVAEPFELDTLRVDNENTPCPAQRQRRHQTTEQRALAVSGRTGNEKVRRRGV